jgi:folate-binding protein YgfZ
MDTMTIEQYEQIRSGGLGFIEQERGLIAVWGKEARQFLDGLITNDVKTLEDGAEMLAAFPNAQGRLVAVVRVKRTGDRYLFETEGSTRETIFNNLFRFTFAGDFFVEDLSSQYSYFEFFGSESIRLLEDGIAYGSGLNPGCFVTTEKLEESRKAMLAAGGVEIGPDLHETLRIESGTLKYGVDYDDATIVPELGLEGLISYTKGCYIGQEIIARIHFRGHVAKRLTGLVIDTSGSEPAELSAGVELTAADGRNAGRITSVTFSPTLGSVIAIAVVRFDHLEPGTILNAGGYSANVAALPFI